MGFVGARSAKANERTAIAKSRCGDSEGSTACTDLEASVHSHVAAKTRAKLGRSKGPRRSHSPKPQSGKGPLASIFAPHAKNAELLATAQEEVSASNTRAIEMRYQAMMKTQSQYDVAITAALHGLTGAQEAAAKAGEVLPPETVKKYLDGVAMIEACKHEAIEKQRTTIDAAHQSTVRGFDEHLKRHGRLNKGALADITKSSALQYTAYVKGAKACADAAQLALEESKHLQQSKLTRRMSNTSRLSPSSSRPSLQAEQLELQMGLMRTALEKKYADEAAEREQNQVAQFAKARDDLKDTFAALKRLADETAALLQDRKDLERKAAMEEEQRKLVESETTKALPSKTAHKAAPLRAPATVLARLAGPRVQPCVRQQPVPATIFTSSPVVPPFHDYWQQSGSATIYARLPAPLVQPLSPQWSEPAAQNSATPPAVNPAENLATPPALIPAGPDLSQSGGAPAAEHNVMEGMPSLVARKVLQELRRESFKTGTTDDTPQPLLAPTSLVAGLEQKVDQMCQHLATIKTTAAGGAAPDAKELRKLESLDGKVQELQQQIAQVKQQPQDNWPAVLRPVVTAVLQWWSPSEPTKQDAEKQAPPSDEAAPPDSDTKEPESEPTQS